MKLVRPKRQISRIEVRSRIVTIAAAVYMTLACISNLLHRGIYVFVWRHAQRANSNSNSNTIVLQKLLTYRRGDCVCRCIA